MSRDIDDPNRDELGRFQPGHEVTPPLTASGGEGGLKRIARGKELVGAAAGEYAAALTDLALDLDRLTGIDREIVKRCASLCAIARLFDLAVLTSAARGDEVSMERFMRRSGWINSKALAALQVVRDVAIENDLIGTGPTFEGRVKELFGDDSD